MIHAVRNIMLATDWLLWPDYVLSALIHLDLMLMKAYMAFFLSFYSYLMKICLYTSHSTKNSFLFKSF